MRYKNVLCIPIINFVNGCPSAGSQDVSGMFDYINDTEVSITKSSDSPNITFSMSLLQNYDINTVYFRYINPYNYTTTTLLNSEATTANFYANGEYLNLYTSIYDKTPVVTNVNTYDIAPEGISNKTFKYNNFVMGYSIEIEKYNYGYTETYEFKSNDWGNNNRNYVKTVNFDFDGIAGADVMDWISKTATANKPLFLFTVDRSNFQLLETKKVFVNNKINITKDKYGLYKFTINGTQYGE